MSVMVKVMMMVLLMMTVMTFMMMSTVTGSDGYKKIPGEHIDYARPRTHMNPVEVGALFEVMEAMAGDVEWRALHPHPCTEDIWPGLVCEEGSAEDGAGGYYWHVTRLDFGYKPNPPCMPNATLPPAIAKLSSLQSLFVFNCFTSYNATIPVELKHLAPSLQELSLRSNTALVGNIPPEIGELFSLQVLSLSQNSLEGGIPASLGNLTNLQHLDLSYNMLSGEVPKDLGKLVNLIVFDLSVNALSGSIPSPIGNLTMLQKLDLSFNMLEGSLPESLGGLTGLQFLSVSDNLLTGPFPSLFNNLKNLQYLIMHDNPMNTGLPDFLGDLQNMLQLSLSNSGYSGPIPGGVGQLRNLSVLAMDRNNLTGAIPPGLADLPHIYEMNLSGNLLSGAIPFTPAFVHHMGKNLDLHDNPDLCSHWSPSPEFTNSSTTLRLCSNSRSSGYPMQGSIAAPFPPSTIRISQVTIITMVIVVAHMHS